MLCSCVNFSPTPSPSWVFPLIKKGTSAPILRAICSSLLAVNLSLYILLMPLSTAAAFAEPPPNPLPVGIFFSILRQSPLTFENSFFISLYALKQIFDLSVGIQSTLEIILQP